MLTKFVKASLSAMTAPSSFAAVGNAQLPMVWRALKALSTTSHLYHKRFSAVITEMDKLNAKTKAIKRSANILQCNINTTGSKNNRTRLIILLRSSRDLSQISQLQHFRTRLKKINSRQLMMRTD